MVKNEKHYDEPKRRSANRRKAASINYQRHNYHYCNWSYNNWFESDRRELLRCLRLTKRFGPKIMNRMNKRIDALQYERSRGYNPHSKYGDWEKYYNFCNEMRERKAAEIARWRKDNPRKGRRKWEIEIVRVPKDSIMDKEDIEKIKNGISLYEGHIIYDRETFAITHIKHETKEAAMKQSLVIQGNAKKFFKGELVLAVSSQGISLI